MTAPLIVGVPSAAHREALLRETAGGGRVPTLPCDSCDGKGEHPLGDRRYAPCTACDGSGVRGLILSHPTDPEAGAMGLARLAWVANHLDGVMGGLRAPLSDTPEAVLRFGARCVAIGLLDRVECVEVPHG